jgi:hypothetical protein
VHEHLKVKQINLQEIVATLAGYFKRWAVKTNNPRFSGFVGNGAQ